MNPESGSDDRPHRQASTGRSFWLAFLASALATLLLLGTSGGAIAWFVAPPPLERFRSSVFEFSLPRGWRCASDGPTSTCEVGAAPFAVTCILTMKYRGPADNRAAYVAHLSAPQPAASGGGAAASRVVSVGTQRIGAREWVVGRHFESEVRNYYTDYYAGLTSHVAILITFSTHKDHVARYERDIRTMVGSLKVYQAAAEPR